MSAGVERVVLPHAEDGIGAQAILDAMWGLGFKRILIEGGPHTLSRFVAAGLIDRLHIMIAPMIIGSGPVGLQLPPIAHLSASLRPRMRVFRLDGSDILCDCDLTP
jgi:riboflavin biosynthesis pyrimidine reductase